MENASFFMETTPIVMCVGTEPSCLLTNLQRDTLPPVLNSIPPDNFYA
jgi:hypothetical protein